MKIVVRVSDGLGNQLFEYALGKYLSDRLGCEMVFDKSHFLVSANRTFQLDCFSGPSKIRRWGMFRECLFLLSWALRSRIGENRFKAIFDSIRFRKSSALFFCHGVSTKPGATLFTRI